MGHKAKNCWEHEANKDRRPKNWKKKEDKEERASNIEVPYGCTKTIMIEYENSKVLFEIELWELVLQKLDEIPVPSNPPDDNKNDMGNINMEENKKDGLDGENSTGGTECCLRNIEKLALPARVALLQSANIWVGDLGASLDCMNNRCGGSNICKGSGIGTIGTHGEAMTTSSIMDISGTWCKKFVKGQLNCITIQNQTSTCSVLGKPP